MNVNFENRMDDIVIDVNDICLSNGCQQKKVDLLSCKDHQCEVCSVDYDPSKFICNSPNNVHIQDDPLTLDEFGQSKLVPRCTRKSMICRVNTLCFERSSKCSQTFIRKFSPRVCSSCYSHNICLNYPCHKFKDVQACKSCAIKVMCPGCKELKWGLERFKTDPCIECKKTKVKCSKCDIIYLNNDVRARPFIDDEPDNYMVYCINCSHDDSAICNTEEFIVGMWLAQLLVIWKYVYRDHWYNYIEKCENLFDCTLPEVTIAYAHTNTSTRNGFIRMIFHEIRLLDASIEFKPVDQDTTLIELFNRICDLNIDLFGLIVDELMI